MGSDADKIIDLYRRHAGRWAEMRGQRFLEKHWLDKFIGYLPAAPSILDLGCGSGAPIGQHLLESGCDVTGIDASPELIAIAQEHVSAGNWIVSDMRGLQLKTTFHGILAWYSLFHLTPDDQRQLFPVFTRHAKEGALLMFTSGPSAGVAIGEFEGEPLYHASLDADEYWSLLDQNGFQTIEHVIEGPDASPRSIWIARRKET